MAKKLPRCTVERDGRRCIWDCDHVTDHTFERPATRPRCPDCGEWDETKGHQTCQYPRD